MGKIDQRKTIQVDRKTHARLLKATSKDRSISDKIAELLDLEEKLQKQ